MNNEQLIRMYAGYINGRVKVNAALFQANSNSKNDKGQTIMSPSLLADCHEGTFRYSDFKLSLRRLSAITDEDAIEVAKILMHPIEIMKIPNVEVGLTGKKVWTGGNGLAVIGVGNLYWTNIYANLGSTAQNHLAAFDKLRELGYDCGFADIPSLIDAGYAVEEGETKPKTL